MDTTTPPSPPNEKDSSDVEVETQVQDQAPAGFMGLLIKSITEPGANATVVMAMNISFLMLILTLLGLGFLTDWNKHVLLLLTASTLLWGAMVWFVMEITRVQDNPENMPVTDPLLAGPDAPETRKDR